MDAPQVSVVLPTRDRAAVVGRAVASVLAQTFSDSELIVVDDGSTDNTIDVIRSFADPRLRVVRLTESGGPSRARNEGVRSAGARSSPSSIATTSGCRASLTGK
jgi:glycosyltransferase involved in cell wall biosynthesis